MKQLTESEVWKFLTAQAEGIRIRRITESTQQAPAGYALKLHQQGIQIDFSHQHLDQTILDHLLALAQTQHLPEKISSLFSGDKVNSSEQRPALHTALRVMNDDPIMVDGHDVVTDILSTREKMREIVERIRASLWLGYSGMPITDIVNIGIGGSDLGPRFALEALSSIADTRFNYHFVSDIDPNAFQHAVKHLKPETTLFIIASKSFTTKETLLNAQKAIRWYGKADISQHFIAVTANAARANTMGFTHVLPIWDWVGGRFSFCSAINLITAIAVGFDAFMEVLRGAHAMDQHFLHASMHENMPILLGLIGIWNINFLHISNVLMLIYARQLEKWVSFVQQLEMESLGKSIDMSGRAVNYATGPMIWGGMGNQAQHSYLQLLCQGTHLVATDFISVNTFSGELINELCRAKIKVLSQGLHHDTQGYIPGGMPLNHIQLKACDPFHVGALVALYEHKVYVQGAVWGINVFDQPGVELAKRVLFENQSLFV